MPAGIPLGPYLLRRRLATGGMAEIFLATKRGPEGFARDLVVKRILPHLAEDEEFTAMFLDEARLVARLAHPNVVHVYDFGEVDGSWYLAMELVRGVDLMSLVGRACQVAGRERRPGALPPHHAAKILSFVCEGLAHAHALTVDGRPLGLVHRDVTPSNVLVSFEGAVKVTDFGVAKLEHGSSRDRTQHGMVRGKHPYLSPEQARGERLDARSDLYNVGILLFEMLTGDWLLPHDDPRLARQLSAAGRLPDPGRIDRLPGGLAAIASRALAPRPEERYADALALRADLEAYLRASGATSDTVELGRYVRSLFPDALEEDAKRPVAAGTALITEVTDASVPAVTTDPITEPFGAGPDFARGAAAEVSTDAFLAAPADAGPPAPRGPVSEAPTASASPPPRRRGLLLAGALGLAALGAMLGFSLLGSSLLGPRGRPPRPPVEPPRPIVEPLPPPPATLRVTTDPAGLALRVDGLDRGPAPLLIELDPTRPHRVSALRDGVVVSESLVEPEAGATVDIELLAPDEHRPRVRVVASPVQAQVFVDGELRGATPTELELELGEHALEVRADGHGSQEATVELTRADETQTVSFVLQPTPTEEPARPTKRRVARGSGTLTIATTPWSEVYLGGRHLGTTPLANVSLPAGRHTLTLRAPGRAPRRKTVSIRAGRTTRVRELL